MSSSIAETDESFHLKFFRICFPRVEKFSQNFEGLAKLQARQIFEWNQGWATVRGGASRLTYHWLSCPGALCLSFPQETGLSGFFHCTILVHFTNLQFYLQCFQDLGRSISK